MLWWDGSSVNRACAAYVRTALHCIAPRHAVLLASPRLPSSPPFHSLRRPISPIAPTPVLTPRNSKPKDVTIPHMQESIDWCEPSPPPVHGFEESPIVVEFEYEE